MKDAGVDLEFSLGGGANFQKIFENFVDHFLESFDQKVAVFRRALPPQS